MLEFPVFSLGTHGELWELEGGKWDITSGHGGYTRRTGKKGGEQCREIGRCVERDVGMSMSNMVIYFLQQGQEPWKSLM